MSEPAALLAVPDGPVPATATRGAGFVPAALRLASALGARAVLLGQVAEPPVPLLRWTTGTPRHRPEGDLAAIRAAMAHAGAARVVLPDTPLGRDRGRRLAARAGCGLAPSVIDIAPGGAPICLCADGAYEYNGDPGAPVWLLSPDFVARPVARCVPATPGRPAPAAEGFAPPDPAERHLDLGPARNPDPGQGSAQALGLAPFILAGGNGLRDWEPLVRLCARLGAAPGASRPVCDRRLQPRDRQVGSSGTLVKARCYVAFGISGAVQHLEGIAACERVAAVNTDPGAPIHRRAELSVTAEAGAVIAALHALLDTREAGR